MVKPILKKEEYLDLVEKIGSVRGIARYLQENGINVGRNKVRNDLKIYNIELNPEARIRIAHPSEDEVLFHAEKLKEPFKKPDCGYDKNMIKIVGYRVYDEKTIEELWDSITEYQEAHNGQKTVCRKVEVEYDDDFLLIIFLADIHIGSESSELRLIRYHMKEIARRKNVAMILCGDYTDNFITFAQNEQLIQPTDQQKLLDYIINTIKDKVIGCVRGNHDERDKAATDKDMVEMTCIKANIPYLGAEGWLTIKVKEQEYRIYAAHKGKFNSSLNQTHAVKKAFEQNGDFDIGVIAHNHTGAIEEAPRWGLHRIYIRPGTYKIYDRYAINHNYGESEVCTPAVLLFGNQRQMIPFYSLENALLVLDLLQKEKKLKR